MSRPACFTRSILPCALFAAFATVTAANAADSCDALYNAGIKSIQAPHHVYTTTTLHGGKARFAEAIFDGKVEYLQLNGKWTHSPMSQQDMLEAAQEKLRKRPDTCVLAGEQTAGGQAVTAYKVHNNEAGTDQVVHILKSNGLLQSASLKLPDGSVVDTRYEYTDVHAPAGVQ